MDHDSCRPVNPGISKDTYKTLDTDSKLLALFDFAVSQSECLDDIFKKVESKRKIDISIAAGTGFVGGFVAVLGKIFLFK